MKIVYHNDKSADIIIHSSYKESIAYTLFTAIGCAVKHVDTIETDALSISDSISAQKAKSIAVLAEECMASCQELISLDVSIKPSSQPLRHYTVDIGPAFSEKHNLVNNQIVTAILPSSLEIYQCTIHINEKMDCDEEIRVPNKLKRSSERKIIILVPNQLVCNTVKVQMASLIRDDVITINNGLYEYLKKFSPTYLEFRHLATGATMTRPFSSIDGSNTLREGEIRLNYYQREILNIFDSHRFNYSSTYISILKDKILRTNTCCERFINDDSGELTITNIYNSIQIVPLFTKNHQHRSPFYFFSDLLVGGCEMNLSAARPYKLDDARDIVRLSEDTMILLGIEETDRVIIKYKDQTCKACAMKIDSFELMKETNIVDSEIDIDIMVGIPAPLRSQLGIGDIETEVTIKRDTMFLFNKNLNIQMLSVLGLLLAVYQIGEGNFKLKSILCISMLPIIIYVSLSQERSKVKKYRRVIHSSRNVKRNKFIEYLEKIYIVLVSRLSTCFEKLINRIKP